VHEAPSEENLEALVPIFKELDLFGSSDEVLAFETGNPHAMQAVLARSEKTPSAYLVSTMLLRAQKRAIYLDHNEGHFALGTAAYCHFTSPIRRYPDDTVHRALKAYLEGKLPKLAEGAHALPQLCRDCSDKERVADAAAHASQDVKMAELFEDHVGEAFPGIVDGVERFGIFVVLDDTMAEGLVPIRSLGDEYFDYDETRMTLTGEQSGKRYRLGQRVAVTVHDVDTMRGRIGFALAANQAPASRRAETGRNA
jgi:ribonuclease R